MYILSQLHQQHIYEIIIDLNISYLITNADRVSSGVNKVTKMHEEVYF